MQILKEEVRERIVAAAAKEFVRYGYRQSSTRRIAQRARVGKSNLYNYFPGKQELFSAVTAPFQAHFRGLLDEVTGHLGGESLRSDAAESISRSIASFIRANRDAFITIMEGSEGTKYGSFKEEVISALASHFAQNLSKKPANDFALRTRFMHIVARLFVDALIAIARGAAKDEEIEATIALYLAYHMGGMAQFY